MYTSASDGGGGAAGGAAQGDGRGGGPHKGGGTAARRDARAQATAAPRQRCGARTAEHGGPHKPRGRRPRRAAPARRPSAPPRRPPRRRRPQEVTLFFSNTMCTLSRHRQYHRHQRRSSYTATSRHALSRHQDCRIGIQTYPNNKLGIFS